MTRTLAQRSAFNDYDRSPGLKHWRTVLADTQGPTGGRAAQICYVGDSITEGFYAVAARSMRWVDQLNLRLSSGRGGIGRWIQVSSGLFNTTTGTITDWPASDLPIRYNGTVAQFTGGLGGHGATIASGYIETDYLGDLVTVFWQRNTASSSTAYVVTIDGVSAGTIAANGSTLNDQYAQFGTTGNYGFHTIRVTVPAGTFFIEGFQTSDVLGTGFGVLTNGVMPWESARAGTLVNNHSGSPEYDSLIDGQPIDLFVIELGQNDIAGGTRTVEQYKTDLVTLMTRLDGRANSNASADLKRPAVGFLLIAHWTFPDAWVIGLRDVAAHYGRSTVVDMRDHFDPADIALTDPNYGLSVDGIHPNDRGHARYADILFNILSPQANHPRPVTPTFQTVDALTTPAARSNWAENFGLSTSGLAHIDSSPTVATTVSERRHRMWFDTGQYEFRIELDKNTDQGIGSVWFDGTQVGSNFDGYNASVATTMTTLATVTVTAPQTGWHYVTVRKNGTKNASSTAYGVTFRRLNIMRKTVTPT